MAQADIQLQIPSAVFYIEPVRIFVGHLARSLGFSRKRVADIQLVLDEICSNAVHHGSADPTDRIKLYIGIDEHTLEILVKDSGSGQAGKTSWLTPERLSEIETNRSASNERGHGIFIVKSLSDRHEMRPNEIGGTDVRAVFHFPKPSDIGL